MSKFFKQCDLQGDGLHIYKETDIGILHVNVSGPLINIIPIIPPADEIACHPTQEITEAEFDRLRLKATKVLAEFINC